MSRSRSKSPRRDRGTKRQAEYDAFVAGLTAISRHFGVAIAATGGVRLGRHRGEFAEVTYLAHLPSGYLEPSFPGDRLDTVVSRLCPDRARQAQFDAFLACLTALTQQFGVVLYPTRGVYLAGRPGEFAALTYAADIPGDRLDPCFPNDGKGAIETDAPSGIGLRVGDRVIHRPPDGRRSVGLVQGWRQGQVVIRYKAGQTADVAEADCERRN